MNSCLKLIFQTPMNTKAKPLIVPVYFLETVLFHEGFCYGVEKVLYAQHDLRALQEAHWAETESPYRTGDADPDYEVLIDMEANQQLVTFTVRKLPHNGLCGMLGFYLGTDLHQAGQGSATEMEFYLMPEFRRGTIAARLLAYSEDVLRKLGMARVEMSDKQPVGGVDLSRFLQRRGYTMCTRLYHKSLREP